MEQEQQSLYCVILFLFSDYMTLMTKLNIVKMKNYISLFTIFRLHEFDDQVKWVREGMAKVVQKTSFYVIFTFFTFRQNFIFDQLR
jgi:hypothetical protein